ncbi:MAG: hypothetical protein ACRD0L_12560, partial [Acidimicrobiales bacterium]
AEGAPEPPTPEAAAFGEAAPKEVGTELSSSGPVPPDETVPGEAAPEAPAPAESAGEEAEPEGAPPEEVVSESRLQRRDEAVEPIVSGLARKLKRALQDDQNDLLDRLRSEGAARGPALLADAGPQRDHFAKVSADFLRRAAVAGAAFVAAEGGGSGGRPDTGAAGTAGRAQAGELADSLGAELRRRLELALFETADADEAGVAEMVGAAYREWKGQRIERLAGDHVVAAFTIGVLSASSSEPLAWIVDDEGGPCPDCDDNALAGPQEPGARYPTGQTHPPAHPGCRCLLAPA